MKNYKYFRVLVCLLLVCALIISISPIKAQATEAVLPLVPAFAVSVPASLAIGAIVVALGVMVGVETGAFDALVDACTAALERLGLVVDGMVESWSYSGKTYVSEEVIEAVRSCMIDSRAVYHEYEYLSASTILTKYGDASESVKAKFEEAIGYGYVIVNRQTAPWVKYSIYVCNSPIDSYIDEAGQKTYVTSDGSSFLRSSEGSAWSEVPAAAFAVTATGITLYVGSGVNKVVTSSDLTLGNVVLDIIEFPAAYETWGNTAIKTEVNSSDGGSNDEDDPEEKILYPVTIPGSYSDVQSMDQDTAQKGELSQEDGSAPGTGTGTGSGTISGTISLPGWVQDGINNLLQGLKDLLSGVLSLPAAIAKSIWEALPSWLQEGIISLKTGLVDILDSIASLPVEIAEALAAVFVPSADYISAKVEALRGEFGFIDSVIATGEFIRDSISGASGPPVIYVDLGRASSGNYGSQRVLLTDFSWYAPYKGQVDTVLSAALWAFFGWRVFLKLPGIIGGESGYISDVFFPSSSGRSGSDDKKKGGKG